MQGVFGEVVLWIYVQLATIMQENALYYGEETFMKFKNKIIESIFLIFPLLLALICLASVSLGSHQASLPTPMPQEFIGKYSYDGENWQDFTENANISALEGDLFLQGHFLRGMKEGWQLHFYRNHIGASVKVNGEQIYTDAMLAIPNLNTELFVSMCAREWMVIPVPEISPQDLVEIRLHNPHSFGNSTAYRDFLTTLCADMPGTNFLQKNLEVYGQPLRVIGCLLAAASLMLIGGGIAAVAARIPISNTLFKLGLLLLCAGGFIAFDTIDLSFWNELNVLNTYAQLLCMIMAVFSLEYYISGFFADKWGVAAKTAVWLSALYNCVLFILSFAGAAALYDLIPYWIASQLILCPFFLVFCVVELKRKPKKRLVPLSAIAMFAMILFDIAGIGSSIVWRSPCSKIAFVFLFVVQIVAGAKEVVVNYRASVRAEKLEKELEDSRTAIMLSQIKPHFLYNVLNTIYHLYRKEPETAQEAVSSFAEYLRCNMHSIEKNSLIPFSEEYQHIQTYLSLEQIRFRGKLDVVYDVEMTNFTLPPLTVEPLVENAVKHGVTKKRGGGVVTISTRKTNDGYSVTVSDTGVGFDPDHYMEDGKQHIGIRNVKERLQKMVGGSLSITSTQEGTIAVVTIPEKVETNENHSS